MSKEDFLKECLQARDSQIRIFSEHNKGLLEELKQSEAACFAFENQAGIAQEELKEVRSDLGHARTDRDHWREQYQKLEDESVAHCAEVLTLQQELQAVRLECGNTKEDLERARKEYAYWREKYQKLEDESIAHNESLEEESKHLKYFALKYLSLERRDE